MKWRSSKGNIQNYAVDSSHQIYAPCNKLWRESQSYAFENNHMIQRTNSGFMPGRSIAKPIFLLTQLMKKFTV